MSLVLVPVASAWTDVGVPLIIAFLAGAIAAFWPWLQALQRGRKFQRIIRRELQEVAPYPEHPDSEKPWWEHATKRFIHEEFFQRGAISQNRDFLLSLDPTVVYQVSQLWIALEKRDGRQWMHFLFELANSRRVGSQDLKRARDMWKRIIDAQRSDLLETMGIPTAFRQAGVLARAESLFERRFEAYGRLLPLTKFEEEEHSADLDSAARDELADKLITWFYDGGSGLLLSGRSFEQFQKVRETLRSESATPLTLRAAFSKLRTDLKIDLGVRQPPERDVAMAWPEDERW